MDTNRDLANINRKILSDGETLPVVKLKDGTPDQTGTVATMLHNIKLYNASEQGHIEEELKLSIPTLIKVGLFELFSPEEWIAGNNPGRVFLGTEVKRYLNQEVETSAAKLSEKIGIG